ncbi:MAG: RNA polymerase sigma factor (sigma-70 family) [Saprospiraceae bacterium]|jgi:RNA polymerase sigma factor (sigma-70 family)
MLKKEEKLFDEIFLQFHSLLFSYGKKIIGDEYTTEECIQELFLYIYQKEIDLANIKNIKAYLLTSFRRRVLLKKKILIKFEELSSIPSDMQFIQEDFLITNNVQEERKRTLASMLNDLPWRQREAIYLKYFNGLTGKEVAKIMGIQPQVVANMVYKALKKLKLSASRLLLFLLSVLLFS